MDNTIQLYVDKKKEVKGYPITSPDRVIDEKGVNIKEQLDTIGKEINDKINRVSSDKRILKHTFGHCVDWSFRGGNGGNWTEERILRAHSKPIMKKKKR